METKECEYNNAMGGIVFCTYGNKCEYQLKMCSGESPLVRCIKPKGVEKKVTNNSQKRVLVAQ